MAATIAFIGGGNMAASLIGGLLKAGHPAAGIRVAEPLADRAAWLREKFGIATSANAAEFSATADVVVLAVKPQQMREALQNLPFSPGTTVISIAAGVPLSLLRKWLGSQVHLVRTMPNTPALLGAGVTGLYADVGVPAAARELADYCLRAAGGCVWLDREDQLDAVTAVSGSGPAYFFRVTEAIRDAGITLGLTPEVAAELALQTFIGAAKMAEDAQNRQIGVAELRQNVTSKGGTTEAALRHLDSAGLDTLFTDALRAAALRSRELGEQLAQAS